LKLSKAKGVEIMTMTLELDKKTYGQLLGRALPHVIHTEEECERLTNELMGLDELIDSSPEEKELAELLTVLIGEYETRLIRYRTPAHDRRFDI
jgi:D-arabinose 1-dehydrogenase-like Zn-dependent alcohol dehydrogenase